MTSVLRKWAQLDPRTQFFYTIGGTTGYRDISSNAASIMTNSAFTSTIGTQPTLLTASANPTLLKDLGRQIVVYDNTIGGSPHIAIFRQVMALPAGTSGTEGINSPLAYVCTWVDNPVRPPPYAIQPIARTG